MLGSTFLNGDQEELEERSQETVAEVFGAEHPSVMNFLFCDGSVRPVRFDIDETVYLALSTTNDQRLLGGVVHQGPAFYEP